MQPADKMENESKKKKKNCRVRVPPNLRGKGAQPITWALAELRDAVQRRLTNCALKPFLTGLEKK